MPKPLVVTSNGHISDDKIFKVLDLVATTPSLSQRELASSTGFSLGLVNLIIKRLVQTGYIRVKCLDQRKVHYILTPAGLLEKSRRTYSYVTRTIRTFLEYQWRIEKMARELQRKNLTAYAVLGDGEVAPLVEMVLKTVVPNASVRRVKVGDQRVAGETILDCRLEGRSGSHGIAVLSHLLEKGE